MSDSEFDIKSVKTPTSMMAPSAKLNNQRVKTPMPPSLTQTLKTSDLNDVAAANDIYPDSVLQLPAANQDGDQDLESAEQQITSAEQVIESEGEGTASLFKGGSKQNEEDFLKEPQSDEKSTDHSDMDSLAYLIPPSNYRRCEGEDVDTLMIENDRLRYIIQTLNQKWSTSNLQKKNREIMDQLMKTQSELARSNHENEDMKAQIKELKDQLKESKETIESMSAKLKDNKSVIKTQKTIKDKMEKKIQNLNGDLVTKNTQNFKLQKQLTVKEKQYTNLTKKLDCYIAHKEDPVDQALGQYLNEQSDKTNKTDKQQNQMKILFLRESEGVYQFGSQKVHVKIGKNKEVKVRVGGGYMAISQFIEKYTDAEMLKIKRNDVVTRFQNKLQMQQICSTLATGKVETIAINEPQCATPRPSQQAFERLKQARKSMSEVRSHEISPMKGYETTMASENVSKIA